MFLNHPFLLLRSSALTRVLDPLVDGLLDDLFRLVCRLDRHGVLLLLAAVGQRPGAKGVKLSLLLSLTRKAN